MKPNALAAKLNGLDLNDMPTELDDEAKRAGLVVVLGVSADTVELHGALRDEIDLDDSDSVCLDADGLLPHPDDIERESEEDQRAYYVRRTFASRIEAERGADGYAWTFTTILPHARFVAHRDGKKYCRGLVLKLSDVAPSR